MTTRRLVALAMVAGVLSLTAPTADAAPITFDFADPVADTPSVFALCDASLQDRCETTLDFTKDGLTVTASLAPGSSGDAIIQDLHPDLGGLGIVDDFVTDDPPSHSGNDNVSVGEIIRLTFDVPVSLHSVGFFDDHESLPHSFPDGSNLFFSVNGGAFVSYSLTGALGASGRVIDFGGLQGSFFDFKHAGQDKDDFYIGSVSVSVEPVPEPGTLLLLGSGVLGLVGRARRRARG